jgi:hypothetical protein
MTASKDGLHSVIYADPQHHTWINSTRMELYVNTTRALLFVESLILFRDGRCESTSEWRWMLLHLVINTTLHSNWFIRGSDAFTSAWVVGNRIDVTQSLLLVNSTSRQTTVHRSYGFLGFKTAQSSSYWCVEELAASIFRVKCTVKMEAAGSSETLATSYRTVRRHIGNGSALHIYLRANSKPQKIVTLNQGCQTFVFSKDHGCCWGLVCWLRL